jgi:hypothetical protein
LRKLGTKLGVALVLVMLSVVIVLPAAANATPPGVTKYKTNFAQPFPGKGVGRVKGNQWSLRVRIQGLNPGAYHTRMAVTRTIYDKAGNPVGTQSAENQICTFKVKNTTSTFGCSRVHKNVPWVLQAGDVLTAEVFGASHLEVSAPLHQVA